MTSLFRKLKSFKKLMSDEDTRFIWEAKHGKHADMPDEEYIKRMFRIRMGYVPDLEDPKTFSEKLQWLKLHDRNPVYHRMADKYEAKQYVAERIGEEHIIPTYGVWERFEDIDFSQLPDQFVLKTTHDSGGVCVCRDKSAFSKEQAAEKLNASLNRSLASYGREWSYMGIQPRILAEKYMENESAEGLPEGLMDYKFYCFNGEPKYIYVAKGLENHDTARRSFLTMDWTFADFGRSNFTPFETLPEKPATFDKMVEIARRLSEGMRFIRVDLYEIMHTVYFGELTFYPSAGFVPFEPEEWDKKLGAMLQL